jgi:hypothetical protein
MNIISDIIGWAFSFSLILLAAWFLVIITPLINDIRKESADPDIRESWQDVRVSINLVYIETKQRILEKIRRTK